MASLNKVTLIGNVGKDPESRLMQSGDKVVSFSVATSESWKDKTTGDKKERTNWHNIVVFNQHIADVIEKYVSKGSKIYIEGAMETRKYTDKDGNERYTTEVVLRQFDGKLVLLGESGGGQSKRDPDEYGQTRTREPAAASEDKRATYAEKRDPAPQRSPIDDDIPF